MTGTRYGKGQNWWIKIYYKNWNNWTVLSRPHSLLETFTPLRQTWKLPIVRTWISAFFFWATKLTIWFSILIIKDFYQYFHICPIISFADDWAYALLCTVLSYYLFGFYILKNSSLNYDFIFNTIIHNAFTSYNYWV